MDIQEADHVVHAGCGTGYYSAIVAHMVGSHGRVTAIEFDADWRPAPGSTCGISLMSRWSLATPPRTILARLMQSCQRRRFVRVRCGSTA